MTDRYVTCRYSDRHGNQCTGQAVDAEGELLLCEKHLARALELLARKIPGLAVFLTGGEGA